MRTNIALACSVLVALTSSDLTAAETVNYTGNPLDLVLRPVGMPGGATDLGIVPIDGSSNYVPSGNVVTIDYVPLGDESNVPKFAIGGYLYDLSTAAGTSIYTTSNNQLDFLAGTVKGNVWGAYHDVEASVSSAQNVLNQFFLSDNEVTTAGAIDGSLFGAELYAITSLDPGVNTTAQARAEATLIGNQVTSSSDISGGVNGVYAYNVARTYSPSNTTVLADVSATTVVADNVLTINGANIAQGVYGAYSSTSAQVNNNTNTSSTANASVSATNNSFIMNGGSIGSATTGLNVSASALGYVKSVATTTVSNNSMVIRNATLTTVYGIDVGTNASLTFLVDATAQAVTHISNNSMNISNSAIDGLVRGIYSYSNSPLYAQTTIADNTFTLRDTDVNYEVYGLRALTAARDRNAANPIVGVATVSGNTMTIDGGNMAEDVYGSYSSMQADTGALLGVSRNNSTTVSNANMAKDLYGTYVGAYNSTFGADYSLIKAMDNALVINDSHVSGIVYGGHADAYTLADAMATGNSVTINGGSVGANIYGGYAYSQSSSTTTTGNTVTIHGGSVGGSVYGGYGFTYNDTTASIVATGNTVNISGKPAFSASNTGLYGGFCDGTPASCDAFSGNTLNLHTGGTLEVNSVQNFQYYNYHIPNSVANGSIILKTATADISGSSVEIKSIEAGSPLGTGDRFILINAGTLTTDGATKLVDGEVTQGISLIYDIDVEQIGNDVVATIRNLNKIGGGGGGGISPPPAKVNPQTKALLEGRVAGLALMNQNADLLSQKIRPQPETGNDLNLFGIMEGSSLRYSSGSHVDLDSMNLVLGATHQIGHAAHLGGFVEAGFGQYDSYNSFTHAAPVKASGNTKHYGIGLVGHYDFDNGLYANGSVRIGQTQTDFKSNDLTSRSGVKARYDSKSNYYGMHVGLGYILNINPKTKLDLSTQYLWTHIESDRVKVAGDPIYLNGIDSHRIRIMGRASHQQNQHLQLKAGLGIEYEFNGKAKGTTYHYYHIDAPHIKGPTGLAELGLSYQPAGLANLSIDAGLQGYVGKRQGIGGRVQLNFSF